MAIQVQYSTLVTISDDDAQSQILSRRPQSITDKTSNTASTGTKRTVPVSTNLQIQMNGVTTASFFYLETDREVLVRIGAADADPVTVKPMATGQTGIFLSTTEFTAVWVENESASVVANIAYDIAGV